MKWSNFKDYFHESWHVKMQPFIESVECDDIYKFLKEEGKGARRLPLIPLSHGDVSKKLPMMR